ncbi:hypothetical protein Tco_1313138 [Tanacetum coccineum]
MAKRDIDLFHSRLTQDDLNEMIIKYKIPLDLHPRLPLEEFVMSELLDDDIGVYHRIFYFFGVRFPFSSFLLALIKHYKVHFTRLGPLGLNKVITFEVLCRSLHIKPTVTLFLVFQTLCKQGDWFSFAKRRTPSLRHPDLAIDDLKPVAGSYIMADVRRLSAHMVKLRDMPEGVLVLSGLSHVWKSRTCDPVLLGTDGNVMGIHDFLFLPEWTGAEVQEEPHHDVRHPFYCTPPTATDAVIPDPTPEELAVSSPSAKRTRSIVPQSSGSTTRPNLFADNSGAKSDDDDACYEILVVTPIHSTAVIPPSGNQDSQGKGIISDADVVAAPSVGGFLSLLPGPYYATYPEGGVAGNCEVTREEWDAPHQPTLTILTKEVFKDPSVCKTVVDQFPTPGEMVRSEALYSDQLTAKMSVLHCLMMSHSGYQEKFASLTGLESQVSALQRQVTGLNDKLSASDASVQAELLSLAPSAGLVCCCFEEDFPVCAWGA